MAQLELTARRRRHVVVITAAAIVVGTVVKHTARGLVAAERIDGRGRGRRRAGKVLIATNLSRVQVAQVMKLIMATVVVIVHVVMAVVTTVMMVVLT